VGEVLLAVLTLAMVRHQDDLLPHFPPLPRDGDLKELFAPATVPNGNHSSTSTVENV